MKAMSSVQDLGQKAAVGGSGPPGSTWSSEGGFPLATGARRHGGTATWRTGATTSGVYTQSRGSGCSTVASEVELQKIFFKVLQKGLKLQVCDLERRKVLHPCHWHWSCKRATWKESRRRVAIFGGWSCKRAKALKLPIEQVLQKGFQRLARLLDKTGKRKGKGKRKREGGTSCPSHVLGFPRLTQLTLDFSALAQNTAFFVCLQWLFLALQKGYLFSPGPVKGLAAGHVSDEAFQKKKSRGQHCSPEKEAFSRDRPAAAG